MRVFVTGAAGVGKTTLSRHLANDLACSCFDLDDLFHLPSDPPFQRARPVAERLALAEALFLSKPDWVLAGHGSSWSQPLSQYFDVVLVLTHDSPAARRARIRKREQLRFGERIAPGGDMYETHQAFMAWISAPDGETGAEQMQDRAWIFGLSCPVLRIDAAQPPEDVRRQSLAALARL